MKETLESLGYLNFWGNLFAGDEGSFTLEYGTLLKIERDGHHGYTAFAKKMKRFTEKLANLKESGILQVRRSHISKYKVDLNDGIFFGDVKQEVISDCINSLGILREKDYRFFPNLDISNENLTLYRFIRSAVGPNAYTILRLSGQVIDCPVEAEKFDFLSQLPSFEKNIDFLNNDSYGMEVFFFHQSDKELLFDFYLFDNYNYSPVLSFEMIASVTESGLVFEPDDREMVQSLFEGISIESLFKH